MVTCTGHIGIHEGADVRTGYQYFLSYGAPSARGAPPLNYK